MGKLSTSQSQTLLKILVVRCKDHVKIYAPPGTKIKELTAVEPKGRFDQNAVDYEIDQQLAEEYKEIHWPQNELTSVYPELVTLEHHIGAIMLQRIEKSIIEEEEQD